MGGHTLAHLIEAYPWIGGVGHNHPAQNSFVLYGGGKELVIDPGYTLKKETVNHLDAPHPVFECGPRGRTILDATDVDPARAVADPTGGNPRFSRPYGSFSEYGR